MNWKLLVFLEACLLAGLQTAKAGPGGARRPTVRMFGNLTSELKTTASRFIAEESAYSLGISISALATDDTGAFSTTFGDHTVEEGTSQLVPSPSTLVYKPTKPVTESTPISQSTQKGVYAEPQLYNPDSFPWLRQHHLQTKRGILRILLCIIMNHHRAVYR